MARIQTSYDEFVGEDVLTFVDEGSSVHNTNTGEAINVGGAAIELSDAINRVCADGVQLESVEIMCTAIRKLLSTVEHAAYTAGAVAQRDGHERVQTRVVGEAALWNSTRMTDELEDYYKDE